MHSNCIFNPSPINNILSIIIRLFSIIIVYALSVSFASVCNIDNDCIGGGICDKFEDEPLAVLYFHIFNLLKNLSVKIKEGDTSNKRCMRYILTDAFRIFKSSQSIPLKSVILEYFYVLSFDQSVLHDMYSNHSLRLMLDKMAESNIEGLEGIVKDIRRLHEGLLNN